MTEKVFEDDSLSESLKKKIATESLNLAGIQLETIQVLKGLPQEHMKMLNV